MVKQRPFKPSVWKHTALETLEHGNSDSFVAENVSPYFEVARFGDPADFAGADLLGNYYLCNIRIYQNIVNLIDSPSDRILVIYGYGHLGWLRQNAIQDRTVRLRTLNEFTHQVGSQDKGSASSNRLEQEKSTARKHRVENP